MSGSVTQARSNCGANCGAEMARAKNKLTAIQIRKAGPGVYQDGGGLSLKKTEDGGKWNFRYSFGGRRRDMGLGSMADVSLSNARKARDRWAAQIAEGIDPISERERLRREELTQLEKSDPCLEDIAKIVLERKKAKLRGGGDRGRWMSPLATHIFPKIGKRRISAIHQKDIYDAVRPIWRQKHPTAEKCIQRLRIIFHDARLMGHEVDPFTIDAARHMLGEHRHETKHIAATPWRDMPALYAKLEGRGATRLALRFQILTVARDEGIIGARFSEIDEGVWTISADRMKGHEGSVTDFRVPLSDEAQRIVETCRRYATDDYLFPSNRKGRHITNAALLKGLNDLGEAGRPHGFRTSFRTWVQETEPATYDVAETALAHTIGNKVERSYARSDLLDPRRILMQKWADHVSGVTAKVVKLRS